MIVHLLWTTQEEEQRNNHKTGLLLRLEKNETEKPTLHWGLFVEHHHPQAFETYAGFEPPTAASAVWYTFQETSRASFRRISGKGMYFKPCILYSYSYGGEWLTGREGHNVPKNNLNIHIKNSLSAVYPQAGWHDSGVLVIKQGYKQRKVAIGPLQEYEYCTLYRPWRRQSKPCRESGFKSISEKEASQLICIIVSCQWTCNVAILTG